ncbi:MAG TPA: glycosyltransferase [Candidatus Brocadiia bacterium]|nr:glycosyltransferase [Candidatus Brocadiia bacterium]
MAASQVNAARRLRVFYLITELDAGGAEKALFELASRLDRTRFEPVVGCLSGRGVFGRRLEEAGVEVVYFDAGRFSAGVVWRVARELRRRQADVMHAFLFHANMVGRFAARLAGTRRVICSVRVEDPRRWRLWADRLTQGLMDFETCVSSAALEYTRRSGVAGRKLVAIPNGIDVALYARPEPAPAEWSLPVAAPVAAVVARLDEQKDPMTMLEAFAMARAPGAVLAWAGDGPLAEAARRRAEELGLTDRVRFLGRLADVRPLLGRADVFALASRWEGMPNCVLEAMASGLPVVATAVGGCRELVEDEVTGLLARPGDAGDLGKKLGILLEQEGLRRKMGEAGRRRAAERFSLDAMVRANEDLYMLPQDLTAR